MHNTPLREKKERKIFAGAIDKKEFPSPLPYRIRQSLSGRIRFFIPALKNNENLVNQLELEYKKLGEITSVEGSSVSGTLLLIYDPADLSLAKIIHVLYNFRKDSTLHSLQGRTKVPTSAPKSPSSLRLQFLGVMVTGVILGTLAIFQFWSRRIPLFGRVPVVIIASATALLAGVPIFREGLEDMLEHKRLSLDFLVSIAVIAAVFFMREGLVALEVVWLMNCGTFLERYTEERSRRAIRKLLETGEEWVWLLVEGTTVRVRIDKVKPDNIVVIHSGEKILVDGVIVSGEAEINQASITGESMPVVKTVSDTVFAGTLVVAGIIQVKAVKVGDDTYLSRVLHLVEVSLETRAPIERISDQFARWFVPSAFIMSIVVYAVTRNFYRAFTVLVTACPCAASIATPTAISAAIGNAAKRNMLIKGGVFIEQASRLDTICLDKTGTLTEGRPRVASVFPKTEKFSEDELIVMAASAEMRSSHPLAHALLRMAESKALTLIEPRSFEVIAGSGVVADLEDGRNILVGSQRLMETYHIHVDSINNTENVLRERGETLLYIACNEELVGLIGVIDTIRSEASDVIREIQEVGIQVYLITGDHQETAKAVSRELGIENYYYDMLPEDKALRVKELKEKGYVIAMVGDGVNDALTLAQSDLGIAMGAGGSDVAVEAADVVLMGNDLTRIPALRKLSLKTMSIIRQNYVYSMGINALGIGLGALGRITPFMGGVLHVGNSLGVILNSSRILLLKDKT